MSGAGGAAAREVLQAVSRSFYLSLRFLPAPVRDPLGLAYLLARASDTVADAVGAGLAARVEALDAFAEALGIGPLEVVGKTEGGGPAGGDFEALVARVSEMFSRLPSGHSGETRLLKEIGAVLRLFGGVEPALQGEMRTVLATILRAQRGDLVRFAYAGPESPQSLQTAADLEAYTYAVAGCVGEFWTRVCVLQMPGCTLLDPARLLVLGRRFGQALQLVNILRDLPEDLSAGRCYLPAEELRAEGLAPGELLKEPQRARRIFERWLGKAVEWLADGEDYVRGIRGVRLRFSVSLPRRIGAATLTLLQRSPSLETPGRVRVGRGTVLACAFESLREALSLPPKR